MFNAQKFYTDYFIPYATFGSKHTRPGWINIHCPFCSGIQDYHLGIHLDTGAVKCWRCGNHSQIEVIKTLIGCSWEQAKIIREEYQSKIPHSKPSENLRQGKVHASICKWPKGTKELSERGCSYLVGREYNPETLKSLWGIKETGPLGDYKFRIIAPIIYNGTMVSYQGRDITGLSEAKYKACKQENEVIEHQKIVYGLDYLKGDSCIIVEGLFDVWRLGYGAVCCFGTAFTTSQINLLANKCRRCFILFDSDDSNAIVMAESMGKLLSGRGLEVEILILDKGDPGEMDQNEANLLMKELKL